MDSYAKLREKKSGEIQYAYRWRQIWEGARADGRLASLGWPAAWEEFQFRRLAVCDANAPLGPKRRLRKPGGGRKPKPDRLVIKQICLSREQCEAVKLAAKAAGISQSAWIREAVAARLA